MTEPRAVKFRSGDERYFEERHRFAENFPDLPLWFVADHWPLFAGRVNIARWLAIYELLKKVNDVPGHILELGTWNGANLVFMAKVTQILRPHAMTEIYGFDSFAGLRRFAPQDRLPAEAAGRYAGNENLLRQILRLYELEDLVHLVVGDIEETLPRFLREHPEAMFCFVYLDTDLFSSTKLGLELLLPRIVPGGIGVLDEFNAASYPGETLAAREVLGDQLRLLTVPFTRQPTAYFVKQQTARSRPARSAARGARAAARPIPASARRADRGDPSPAAPARSRRARAPKLPRGA